MTDLAADNPSAAPADNQSTGPAPADLGTTASSGQATEAAPADLFRGVDPNKLPPEVKTHYDSMLRDYREKTGKLSETIKAEIEKATSDYRTKADQYDQIATQEEFVKMWNDYVQKANGEAHPDQIDPLKQVEAKQKELETKMHLAEMEKMTDAFAEATNDKGEKLHPEFDYLNSIFVGKINQGKEEFSLLRAAVELAPGKNDAERLANGYKAAKAFHDQIFEKGRQAGLGRVQEKIQNGTQAPSYSGGDINQSTEKRPKNASEALEMARKGIRVRT
jgi:hypothetical protein